MSISKKVFVPYTRDQVYRLVQDVERYPDFLPHLEKVELKNASEEDKYREYKFFTSILSRELRFRARTFETQCGSIRTECENKGMKIIGVWKFEENDNGCHVSYEAEYCILNSILNMLFKPIVNMTANRVVACFVKRSHQLYGDTAAAVTTSTTSK